VRHRALLCRQVQERRALDVAAVEAYRVARQAWAEAADAASVYVADVSFGAEPWLRGHWRDRLPAIDTDIAEMARQADAGTLDPSADPAKIRAAISRILSRPRRRSASGEHQPPERFEPGAPLEITIRLPGERTNALLHYRHVNQAEVWQKSEMRRQGDRHDAVIAADYTRSPYPLQYYFEVGNDDGLSLFPGLGRELGNQPYFVVRRA
jgi:hypothetical protein